LSPPTGKAESLQVKRPPSPALLGLTQLDWSDDAGNAIPELRPESAPNLETISVPPANHARSPTRVVVRLCSSVGVAALIAWALVSIPESQLTVGQTVLATFSRPIVDTEDRPTGTTSKPMGVLERLAMASEPERQAEPAASAPLAGLPGPYAGQPQTALVVPRSSSPYHAYEDTSLIKLAERFLKSGDLASARLLLRRAATTGSASAALMLGRTYDPILIQRLGAIGVSPDIAQTRKRYGIAAQLGSSTASRELANLANAN